MKLKITTDNILSTLRHLTEQVSTGIGSGTKNVIDKTGIVEAGKYFFVRVEFPGYDKNNLDIELENKQLIISAKESNEQVSDESYTFESKGASKIVRIPDNANPDTAIAKFKDGVIIVRFEKKNPMAKSINPDENLS
jgi:HSP20 family molecular chaperone IbpA